MLPWKLRKRQILPVKQNLSSVYFSLAKFQLVSCNLSLAMIWQMTYTHKLPNCVQPPQGLFKDFFCVLYVNIILRRRQSKVQSRVLSTVGFE